MEKMGLKCILRGAFFKSALKGFTVFFDSRTGVRATLFSTVCTIFRRLG